MKCTCVIGIILTIACVGLSYGAIPQFINYQGKLWDTSGSTPLPMDGQVEMIFRLYDAETAGNLIVGYNESRGIEGVDDRSGSHNIVVGRQHNFASYGGLVAGQCNTISGTYASVSGGYLNTANGTQSSVSGGFRNTASGTYSSVSGGNNRSVAGEFDWRAGGYFQDQ